ncbi:phosphoribosylamine--glycine ligase [Candidatus Parcubacteria bacterium]|nr:MAG: phosphoribosylamine--glycine ligase [Candidatus Parcubacteria bacterium]
MSKKRSVGNTVVVVDGGGRGSVLVDKYAESQHVERIIAIPGNDLMQINTDKPVEIHPQIKTTSTTDILDICKQEDVALVDVAQDNAVEAGLVDILTQKGILVTGPTRNAGQIEWDKAWAREFGKIEGLPQPFFKICLSTEEGLEFLKNQPDQRWFIKAALLAEGKGVLPAKNNEEAAQRVLEMRKFGDAGKVFLIEKWLQGDDGSVGEEFSTYILTDGQHYKIIGSAQDHKRVNDFDEGENTGGMGCSAPPLVLTEELLKEVEAKILCKAVLGLNKEGRPYKGVLYLGGMVVKQKGKLHPYVIEFNARWGDPEAQVIVPSLVNDLYEVGLAVAHGDISKIDFKTDGKARVVVAGASRGYPGDYSQAIGKEIYGLEDAKKVDGVKIYGAGVKKINGRYYVSGGRLFYVVGEGKTVVEARQKAYEAMSVISIDGNNLHFRTDIGWRDVERLRKGKY